MANRSYLLNTTLPIAGPQQLHLRTQEPAHQVIEVAEASYCIPVPWMCCFTKDDVQQVPQEYTDDQDKTHVMQLGLPCTTVAKAIVNLERSLPVFEALAGDAAIARGYWLAALHELRALPLPWLSMDPVEVLFTADAKQAGKALVAAFGGGKLRAQRMAKVAEYRMGIAPYAYDVLRHVRLPQPRYPQPRHPRVDNAVRLDGGFKGYFSRKRAARGTLPAAPERLPVDHSAAGPDLGTLRQHTDALIKAIVGAHPRYPARSRVHYALVEGQGGSADSLRMTLQACTVAEQQTLQQHAEFRSQVEGGIAIEFAALCQARGLGCLGVNWGSDEADEEERKQAEKRAQDREDQEQLIAAMGGDVAAQAHTAVRFDREGRFDQGFHWYLKASQCDEAQAQEMPELMRAIWAELAERYAYGLDVELDLERALHWNRKAAEAGEGSACFALGMMHLQGRGVPKSLEQAREWFQRGVNTRNFPRAARALKEADTWFEHGWSELRLQYHVAFQYQKRGDHARAVQWYTRAALQAEAAPPASADMFDNGTAAQCNLADKYEHGLGLAQDYAQALYWYGRSAARNNKVAQYSLGIMHLEGRGTPVDLAQARAWLEKSAAQGYADARTALQKIGNT